MLYALDRQLAAIRRAETGAAEVYGETAFSPARARTLRRRGAGPFCPICGTAHIQFLPFGLGGRRNARCPLCGSLERHRFLYLTLENRLKWLDKRLTLLHFAPEPCLRAALTERPNIDYRSVDLFDPKADIKADITKLPLPSDTADAIICSHVLEHIEDDRAALAELYRVLKPGGGAVLMVPLDPDRAATEEDARVTAPSERLKRFGHPYHVRICGRDYPERYRAAGFTVETVESRAVSPFQRRHYRLNKAILHIARKPVSGETKS
jgi:SAM-dependent methyltransferase